MKVDKTVEKAYELAKAARANAYADYSKVKVGAAVKLKGVDEIYSGANIEYAVNGVSLCAERVAIANSATFNGKPELEFVVVCSHTEPVLYPCGVCIQSMSEFCTPELDIYITNLSGILEKVKFKDLFTHQYATLPKVLEEDE